MDGRKPGEVPTDPEEYEALLKRWGLDDDALGISTLRAARGGAVDSSTPDPDPEATIEADDTETDLDADDDPAVDPEPDDDPVRPEPDDPAPDDHLPDSASAAEFDDDITAEAGTENDEIGLDFLDDAEPAVLSTTERKRRRTWLRRSLVILTVVLGLVAVTAGFYLVVGLQALQSLKREPGLLPTDDGYQSAPVNITGPLNFVLMGSDSRGSDRGRSDSLMVAHLNTARDKVYLITLPRDLYVEIPGHGKNKINAAYSFGGPALTVKTVQNLLSTRMDHTVVIDFEGFIGLTTDVGGVTVFNETDSTNLGFHFPRGNITISGEQALAYVRERYDLPGGDLDRAARQRNVVKALILKLLKPEVIGNPATFNAVATKLGAYVTADDKLTNELIWTTATSLNIRAGDDIRQIQAPLSGFASIDGVGSVDLVDTPKMTELAQAVAGDSLGGYWQQYGED
ncbi:MAG: LCP family protein [Propionibacteriales bacterium]|nr:LCP family protein [Propionibacteriales bacterium]